MSFQQGLSGLNAASKSLEAIGNNVANANTVGFKSSTAVFADVYAASLSNGSATDVGLGVKVAQVTQRFTQGNITGSSNPLDIAINGGGFFRMNNNGIVTYARNGQFQLDREGFIVSPSGSRLTGYTVGANGALSTGAPMDLNINNADLEPRQTQDVQFSLNLDARRNLPTTTPFYSADPTSYTNATSVSVFDSLGNSHVLQTFFVKDGPNSWNVYAANNGAAIGEIAAVPVTNPGPEAVTTSPAENFTEITAGTFSINGISIGGVPGLPPLDPSDPNYTTNLAAHQATRASDLAAAIVAANPPGIASVTASGGILTITPGTGQDIVIGLNGAAANAGTATTDRATFLSQTGFDDAQVGTKAVTATSMGTINFNSDGSINTRTSTVPISVPLTVGNGASSPFVVEVDLNGTTQFGSNFSVNRTIQDGYASGRLSGFNIGADGIITGRYTNGRSATLGQVLLVNFTNPNGLQPLGDNAWTDTASSGPPLVGVPGSSTLGSLQSSAVEDSNVDLTAELVNMITAQRVYQANAQSIKTQDQVVQTLLNLR